MAVAGVTIEGANELRRLLGSLTPKLEKKVLRTALRKSGRVVVQEAKRNAPVRSGLLRRKLTVRALKQRRRHMVGVKVTGTQEAPHAHLNELGTVERKTKSGKSTGRMKAKPFMRPALEDRTDEVIRIFSSEIKAGVERERAKIGS